jgi:hypothetical protein
MWAERAIGAVITQLFALQSLTIRYMFCCSVASCRTYVCIMETARRTVPVSRGADRPWRWPRSRLITSAVWTSRSGTWARCVAYAGDVVAGAPYPSTLCYASCRACGRTPSSDSSSGSATSGARKTSPLDPLIASNPSLMSPSQPPELDRH